jgi:hypothetical protein
MDGGSIAASHWHSNLPCSSFSSSFFFSLSSTSFYIVIALVLRRRLYRVRLDRVSSESPCSLYKGIDRGNKQQQNKTMHASKILASMGLMVLANATVIRYERDLQADAPALEKRADKTAAWVTVDDEQQPATTYTPSYTTIDGTTSLLDAAPHDLTASVYIYTSWGKAYTSTGEPPNPQATGKHGEGVFSRCHNKDGDNAPFCSPYANSTLDASNTYFGESLKPLAHHFMTNC